ncbi:hypothetical protein BCR36DRAFT_409049 [Piromyces finnis]|uniref:Uncharacterized protein n=1 Tax=Piromyces finnis TaxID=1754191 RepID=A0A1Y1VL91_9FUNG|nr:hypothetical protein BCR36DRAFT_409049 [Piromyces finnis]|eukprot:ORX58538.1 hypothetical protein BCR36DRAFT_409049 [Piromyces finnis]
MSKFNNEKNTTFYSNINSGMNINSTRNTTTNETALKVNKSSENKISTVSFKSPNLKTPLKPKKVTNFNDNQSPNNIDLNKTYDKFIQKYATPPQQISPSLTKSKNKKRISLTSNNSDINKRIKIDISPNENYNNKNIILSNYKNSPTNNIIQNQIKKKNVINIGNVNQQKTTNKFVNLSKTFEKINENLKETKQVHASNINTFQNQYSNFINSYEKIEFSQLTSPNKDWNSKNLLSSYAQQNLKFVKNGYSERLVNIIAKKRSNFHIWLHSIQKSKSINDMFKNTVIVEIKQVFTLNSNIEMKCRLVASFQENFSNLYRKEGGKSSLEIIVLTNFNRSWPSQNNIENEKIIKLLKDLKEKNHHAQDASNSIHTFDKNDNIVTLCNKNVQNGTLLVIKEPKTILHQPLPLSKTLKKSIIIYNDLFLIFNV